MMDVFGKKLINLELLSGLGHADGGRVDIQLAVVFRHSDEKKHSRVLFIMASYGIQPTLIPGITNIGGGIGSII